LDAPKFWLGMHYCCKNKGNHVEVLTGQEGLRDQVKKKKKKKKEKKRVKFEVFNPEVATLQKDRSEGVLPRRKYTLRS